METRKSSWAQVLEFAFLVFIVSFFLTLGSDFPSQMLARMGYGGVLLLVFFVSLSKESRGVSFKSFTSFSFLSFVLFEIFRSGWALAEIFLRHAQTSPTLPLHQYLSSPLKWSFYLGFFALSDWVFRKRPEIRRLLWLLSGSGFVIALNAVPRILLGQTVSISFGKGGTGFFPPIFYFHPVIPKYLISTFAHVNYTGDLIALGFFPALGLLFYSLQHLGEKKLGISLALLALIVVTTALATVMFLSRGTILSFSIAFLIYLLATGIKFPSRRQWTLTGFIFLLVLGFVFWAGNVEKALKEVRSVSGEFGERKETSFSTNREGARRALAIYQVNPIWGVGTDGYAKVSLRFAAPGMERSMANNVVLCHYLQLLAEEGMGAYLYFLFLLGYFFEVIQGLWRSKSRFQFMAGLSLAIAVGMVLIHASINQLMERFSISMLISILMGASLGVLSKDFIKPVVKSTFIPESDSSSRGQP